MCVSACVCVCVIYKNVEVCVYKNVEVCVCVCVCVIYKNVEVCVYKNVEVCVCVCTERRDKHEILAVGMRQKIQTKAQSLITWHP